MADLIRLTSPGVQKLIPPDIQETIWNLYDQHPDLLPAFFDLAPGRKRYVQAIFHFCLIPYYHNKVYIDHPAPVDDLRLVIRRYEDTLLLKIRNLGLEESLINQPVPPRQGELDL